ncbi:hypothetical protein KUCAC02_021230 [Chaenocephalus aceratus]|uniref:Uncharacterized protein n=1 Tax=Chaenocephalus aceratus TaxID=36190 RepID=A0ACB9XFT9_CHAAC|nr:hypothetical protein KUCAC02_021230 [Chaenocephalus aceratus]
MFYYHISPVVLQKGILGDSVRFCVSGCCLKAPEEHRAIMAPLWVHLTTSIPRCNQPFVVVFVKK